MRMFVQFYGHGGISIGVRWRTSMPRPRSSLIFFGLFVIRSMERIRSSLSIKAAIV